MTFPKITIASFELAETLLGSLVGNGFTHVISINQPGKEPPSTLSEFNGKSLVLHFDDISKDIKGLEAPGRSHVKAILKFARDMGPDHDVLCHCTAGISRSSAAALIIIASKLEPVPFSAMKVMQEVKDIKENVRPNERMVQLADDLLEYDGALYANWGVAF